MIRLRIPELNEERRKELVKVGAQICGGCARGGASCRRDGLDVLKKLEKDHKISEDDHERYSNWCRRRPTRRSPKSITCSLPRKRDPDGLIFDAPARTQHCRCRADAARPSLGAAPACHHHGWQRPLGSGAGLAARRRSSARRRGAAPHRARRRRNRHPIC